MVLVVAGYIALIVTFGWAGFVASVLHIALLVATAR